MDLLERLRAALSERYIVERQLGAGGMSIVYLAQDTRHRRAVAIKVLRPDLAAAIGAERFLREIQIAAQLQHPHILPLYDSGAVAEILYYVMPFVEGESLRDRLERERQLPVADAVLIAREVADALGYAHSHNVIHRDIKPDNILLYGGHAVVADFGIARAITAAASDELTKSGMAVGTAAYMSPEQASAETNIDGRTDIYSLGCVVYEMLAGEPPHTGPTAHAILARHRAEEPRGIRIVRPDVPEAIESAILTALRKTPADRFATATRFSAALERAPSDVTPARRRPARVLLPLGVAALAIVGALWAWKQYSGNPPSALDPTHIAVLYFDDLSDGGKLRHVASGVTQDLIDALGQVELLHLSSPDAVEPYRDRAAPLDSIARTLGVGTVISGSVDSAAGKLVLRVRLTDATTGRQLDGELIERPWGDLLALRDTVISDVADALRGRLGRQVRLLEQRPGTRSLEAWDLYQRGVDLRDKARGSDIANEYTLYAEAESLMARAESLDPKWTAPIVGQGSLAFDLGTAAYGLGRTTPDELTSSYSLGERHAERALMLRPGDPFALALRGKLRYEKWLLADVDLSDTLAAAEQDLRDAVRGQAGLANAWYTLSDLYRSRGQFSESDQAARTALEQDPFLRAREAVLLNLLFTSLNLERYSESEAWCSQGRHQFPRSHGFADCELRVLGWSGRTRADLERAWRLLADIESREVPEPAAGFTWTERRMLIAMIAARAGLRDSARAIVRSIQSAATDVPAFIPLSDPYLHVLLGEPREATELVARYLESSPQMRGYIATSPWFRELHADTSFQRIVGLRQE